MSATSRRSRPCNRHSIWDERVQDLGSGNSEPQLPNSKPWDTFRRAIAWRACEAAGPAVPAFVLCGLCVTVKTGRCVGQLSCLDLQLRPCRSSMPVPLLNLAARTATALRLLIARFPWSRPVSSPDRGAGPVARKASCSPCSVPAAACREVRLLAGPCSLYAADCLAVLFLAGSGLSLRDSGFALWPMCYGRCAGQ